ncbi:prostaglandin E2 receptor EP3 subtype isoform X2 [Frieseomelitta varia]|uniref:prostaglandin E2 receptor EP3 subtype isoform X2 n=1 Tax=Frieseomelitta varia TaxID=561572 RepID=UPI001CB6A51A|nr:prostaglandin E2 receptor EP3 subtype isoform X2 [Frieseomelitta varia]
MSLTSTEVWNETLSMMNSTLNSTLALNGALNPSKRHVTFASQVVLTLVYITGVIGNVSALVILFHRDKRRNRKHLLMLRCLATNDLAALLGMLVQMYITIYVGSVISTRGFCSLRVVWRLFGLFSGCVAIVMAAERWLALTRPFVYQKVTYPMIVRCMLLLWLIALALTSMPVMGFGVYYKGERCIRYREATEPADIAYAYVWFVFGTVLCLSIVWCNLAVSRALSKLNCRAGVLRRVTRSSSRAKPLLTVTGPTPEIVTTAEERAFARLMAVLSISFVVCWMPQMISIPLAQFAMQLPQKAILARKLIRMFHLAADVLLCIHFTLDPYIYVLLRMPRPRFRLLKPLCKICWPARSRSSSFNGTTDHQGSSGDPSTPITEAPSTPVSEEHDPHLVSASV